MIITIEVLPDERTGGFTATSADVPDLCAEGDTPSEALRAAADDLEELLPV